MKRILTVFLTLCLICLPAHAAETGTLTVTTSYNTSVVPGGIYTSSTGTFLPLIAVSEALGAVVFECAEDKSYFIISRDGDVALHTLSSDYFELNGEKISMQTSSFSDNFHRAMVPCEMIEKTFALSVNGSKINRDMQTNYYNKLISNLLNYCIYGDFYPENFTRYYKFYCENPDMDPGVVINSVNIGLDKTYFDDSTVIQNPYSTTILVNKLNHLPDDFVPENLVSVDKKYIPRDGREYLMVQEAYDKFVEMYDAAKKEGLNLRIVSSYRTFDYQDMLFKSYSKNYGSVYSERYSAHPGYSEHHTGLAIDINSVYTTFENSAEYKWLKENAYKFGYIERYKKSEEYITGYAYEPWHYRYVGNDAAKIIYDQNITFEEYYAVYVYDGKYSTNKDRVWANVLQKFHK